MSSAAGITAIVTAHRRVEALLVTLSKLLACQPPPDEVLVHVDGENAACEAAVREAFPRIQILRSTPPVGPGGGRNKLIAAAAHSVVASFDDDSYPLDADYFERLHDVFTAHPEASVIAARVFHVNELVEPAVKTAAWTADFSGGACAYRRDRFLTLGGYVPLPLAYNMEEVDLALRLHAEGGHVLATPWLRVFHDTDLARHADPEVTASSIANLALLAYLRYPRSLWIIGAAQCANRIQWLWRHGRRRGIGRGLADIPRRLRAHQGHRGALPASAVRSYLSLRRHPVPAT